MGGDTPTAVQVTAWLTVSIAGGDSWVGIQYDTSGNEIDIVVSIAGGDSWVGILAPVRIKRSHNGVSIAGGDSWVGIPIIAADAWRAVEFQSQVAILGWGYNDIVPVTTTIDLVSIAGGDSWVGIRRAAHVAADFVAGFNRRWRFLGGDTPAHKMEPKSSTSFNRRWRFLGGDTAKRYACANQ